MTREPRCAHCNGSALGEPIMHTNPSQGREPLCHPQWGLDCYSLVTIAGHTLNCEWCRLIRIEQDSVRHKHQALNT